MNHIKNIGTMKYPILAVHGQGAVVAVLRVPPAAVLKSNSYGIPHVSSKNHI